MEQRRLKNKICILIICCLSCFIIGTQAVQAATPKLSATKKTINEKKTFTLQLKNFEGSASVKWATSNKSVASLKKISKTKYKITGKKAGKATITVKVGKKKYKCVVTVSHKYKSEKKVDSTCSTEGYNLYKCSCCGATKKEERTGSMREHEGDWVIKASPTDSKNGVAEYRCNNCDTIIDTRSFSLEDCFSYVFREGNVVITDFKFKDYGGKIEIPSKIEGKTVIRIEKEAFYGCHNLTEIYIPEGVTGIGVHAFRYCISLKSVNIPKGVTSIEFGTFSYCSNLTSITIPEGVTGIEDYAFRECSSLISISIPENITSIGDETFSGCSSLTSIIIPEGVTSIGESAFSRCSNLSNITIPLKTFVGVGAFDECRNLTMTCCKNSWAEYRAINENINYNSLDANIEDYFEYDVKDDKVSLINYYGIHQSLDIPSTIEGKQVEDIGCVFRDCSNLTSITIPEGVTGIEDYAFRECSSLTSISIPESVTSIGYWAFENCDNLTIYGYSGSYAEEYATDMNIPFVPIL